MSKPLHYHIRAFQLVERLLKSVRQEDTTEGRYALKCLGVKAERAKKRAEKPQKSSSEKEWMKERDKADEAFSRYIRFRDTNGGDALAERVGYCNTCKAVKTGNELQCCHWQSRKHFGTRWHEFNAAGGCWGCNSKMYGNGRPVEFEQYIILIRGKEWPDKLKALAKFGAKKPSIPELKAIIEKFELKLEQLKARESNG